MLTSAPETMLLSITFRFHATHKPDIITPFLVMRGVVMDADEVVNNDDADACPLYSDT